MGSSLTLRITLLCLLMLAVEAGVLAFSSATRIYKVHSYQQPRTQSSLSVATIDASLLVGGGDGDSGTENGSRESSRIGLGRVGENDYFNVEFDDGVLLRNLGPAFGGSIGNFIRRHRSSGEITYAPAWVRAFSRTPYVANLLRRRLFSSSTLTGFTGAAIMSVAAACRTKAVESAFRFFKSIPSWYLAQLAAAPLRTKCVTGGLIALAGDYGAQWFEYRSSQASKRSKIVLSDQASQREAFSPPSGLTDGRLKQSNLLSINGTYNIRRGIARFLECLLISSPLMHYGYDLFESIIPVSGSGLYSSLAALTHVFADSVFLDGIFVGTGIVATGLLEGHSLKNHVLPNLRNVYVPTLKASVVTSGALMPLQFLSFRFLPVQLRVLSINAVDLVWTGVISFMSHNAGIDSEVS